MLRVLTQRQVLGPSTMVAKAWSAVQARMPLHRFAALSIEKSTTYTIGNLLRQ